MNAFFEKLEACAADHNSRLCVGLDPRPEKIPEPWKFESDPVFAFNRAIINATAEHVCAFKPNFAFYEALGTAGMESLKKTIACVPKEIPVIADAKRGDIGSTAEAYASAIFDYYRCDGVTLNPLLGKDSLQPFLNRRDRGLFILCLTSNPGAKDFEMPDKLYLKIARKIQEWNEAGNCGLVTGATHPEYLKEIRALAPDLPLLIPGVGAQGGSIEEVAPIAGDSRGGGYIINVSRAISEPKGGGEFTSLVSAAALDYKNAINRAKEA